MGFNSGFKGLKWFTYVAILILPILGAFEKFRKATFSFVMCVCPSADPSAWNNSAPAEPIFTKFDTVHFSELFQKIQVLFKSDRITSTLQEDIHTCM